MYFYESTTPARFNRIVVIQSLPKGELSTGRRVIDDITDSLEELGERVVKPVFYDCNDSSELLEILSELCSEAQSVYPIVQIDSHGDRDIGLQLASGEVFGWEELVEPFSDLNIAMQNNLIVGIAACDGAYFNTILDVKRPAPFFALAGPTRTLNAGVLATGFSAFYRDLLRTGNLNDATRAVQSHSDTFSVLTTEELFVGCFARLLRHYIRPVPGHYGNLNEEELFESLKRVFFMIDRFPENERRFTMTYQQIAERLHEAAPQTQS